MFLEHTMANLADRSGQPWSDKRAEIYAWRVSPTKIAVRIIDDLGWDDVQVHPHYVIRRLGYSEPVDTPARMIDYLHWTVAGSIRPVSYGR